MSYKGYRGSVEYSEEDRCFCGSVIGIRSCVLFEGVDVDSLEKDFRRGVDDYLDLCARRGHTPEKEYSGSFQVRVPSETHKKLVLAAESKRKKLNTVVAEALEQYVATM